MHVAEERQRVKQNRNEINSMRNLAACWRRGETAGLLQHLPPVTFPLISNRPSAGKFETIRICLQEFFSEAPNGNLCKRHRKERCWFEQVHSMAPTPSRTVNGESHCQEKVLIRHVQRFARSTVHQ